MRYVCLVKSLGFYERETDKYLNAHRLRLPNIDADRDNPIWHQIPGDFGAMSLEFSMKICITGTQMRLVT